MAAAATGTSAAATRKTRLDAVQPKKKDESKGKKIIQLFAAAKAKKQSQAIDIDASANTSAASTTAGIVPFRISARGIHIDT